MCVTFASMPENCEHTQRYTIFFKQNRLHSLIQGRANHKYLSISSVIFLYQVNIHDKKIINTKDNA